MVGAALETEAILLGVVPYGEADRICTLLTRAHGKISALARGARKSRSRFGAALAPYVVGNAGLAEGRGELYTLSGFAARQDFSPLCADVVKMGHAAYATELARELSPPRQPEPEIFELLVDLYRALLAWPARAETLRAFELHVLGAVGLAPALDRCAACGKPADAAAHTVDPSRGGIVCDDCARSARFATRPLRLPERVRLKLIAWSEQPLAEVAADPAPRDAADEPAARQITHGLLAPHLHHPLRSLEFLRQLRRAPSVSEHD